MSGGEREREVLSRGIWCCNTSFPPGLGQTDACENITFAKGAVKIQFVPDLTFSSQSVRDIGKL